MNTLRGFARTERRGVFVSNIKYSVTEKELESLFRKIEGYKGCKLKPRSKDRSGGCATVQFDNEEAARSAIKRYHGHSLKGRCISVRFDTEPTTVEAPLGVGGSAAPLVVDGSRGGN